MNGKRAGFINLLIAVKKQAEIDSKKPKFKNSIYVFNKSVVGYIFKQVELLTDIKEFHVKDILK